MIATKGWHLCADVRMHQIAAAKDALAQAKHLRKDARAHTHTHTECLDDFGCIGSQGPEASRLEAIAIR